jgi:hypothetical protein
MKSAITMRRAVVATAGVAVAGGVIFGATEAFAASPAATSVNAASVSPTSTSTTGAKKAACADAAHPARCALRHEAARDRAALLKRGAHGLATVENKAGAYVVNEWQVGKVGSISGSSVTVTDGSGTTWTWTVDSSTKYAVDGAKGALSGVHVGDTILIRGQQSAGANDATVVRDPNQSKLG